MKLDTFEVFGFEITARFTFIKGMPGVDYDCPDDPDELTIHSVDINGIAEDLNTDQLTTDARKLLESEICERYS